MTLEQANELLAERGLVMHPPLSSAYRLERREYIVVDVDGLIWGRGLTVAEAYDDAERAP